MAYVETKPDGYAQNILDIDFTIEAGFTLVRRNITIADGVTLTIELDGELFII